MSVVATPSATILPKTSQTAAKGKTGTPKSAKTAQNRRVEKNIAAIADKAKLDRKTAAKKTVKKTAPTPSATVKREYGLDAEQIAEFRKEKSHNAYREGSSYWAVVESLFTLGIGKMHHADKLIAEYAKQIDKDSFKAFKSKEKRNEATGLDWKSKVLQNAYVTTRQDYGKRMRDIGYEVRYDKTADGQTFGLYKLTTPAKK